MDEKPLPIACCACCYSCDCNSLQLHRSSPCTDAHMSRLAQLMERRVIACRLDGRRDVHCYVGGTLVNSLTSNMQ